MSDYIIRENTLNEIADAIRTQTGKSDLIPVPNMAQEILDIVSGEYELYAGKDNPENASDGDYWIDTSDEGGGVVQTKSGTFTTDANGFATVDFGFSPDLIRVSNPDKAKDDVAISDFFLWVSGIPFEQDGGQYKSVNCAIDQDSGNDYYMAEASKLTDSEFRIHICGVDNGGETGCLTTFEYTAYKWIDVSNVGGVDDGYALRLADGTLTADDKLPEGMTKIRSYAFSGCTNLALASLPSGITSIDAYAFQNCTSLALTSLPSGLTNIDSYAFQNCKNLALASLPSVLTNIGTYAFYGCTSLALTSLPSEITSISMSAFRSCTNLALTFLPSGITSIDAYAFYGCTKLALTSLPSEITNIGHYAFQGCKSLALTYLPSGITSIGMSAFSGCINLTEVTFSGTPSAISGNAFAGCTNLMTINVPWAEDEVPNAPWGATNATINYMYIPFETDPEAPPDED